MSNHSGNASEFHSALANLAAAAVKPFVQTRQSTAPLELKEHTFNLVLGALNNLESLGREEKVQEWLERKGRLRERLKMLQRLDICTELNPDSEIDLLRLWLDRSVVLTLDGGGYSVAWTLQLLKELERVANNEPLDTDPDAKPHARRAVCADLFDIVAGTSAGAITAALLAKGWSARQIERDFWEDRAIGIWPYRNPLQGFVLDLLGRNHLRLPQYVLRTSFFSMDPPLVNKAPFRKWAKEVFGDDTMEDLCRRNKVGLFLVSTNASTGDHVPAGTILNPFAEIADLLGEKSYEGMAVWGRRGREKALVRAALEASSSPPLHMQPLGPYVDAGAGPDNDPTLTVLRQIYRLRAELGRRGRDRAIRNMGIDLVRDTSTESLHFVRRLEELFWLTSEDANLEGSLQIQTRKEVTVFSMSTSMARSPEIPEKIIQRPLHTTFWLQWLMNEFYLKSSLGPVRLLCEPRAFPQVDYRRFNIAPGPRMLAGPLTLGPYSEPFARIPGISGTTTSTVNDEDLFYMEWLLEPEYMRFHQALGRSTVRFLRDRTRYKDMERRRQKFINIRNWHRGTDMRLQAELEARFQERLLGGLYLTILGPLYEMILVLFGLGDTMDEATHQQLRRFAEKIQPREFLEMVPERFRNSLPAVIRELLESKDIHDRGELLDRLLDGAGAGGLQDIQGIVEHFTPEDVARVFTVALRPYFEQLGLTIDQMTALDISDVSGNRVLEELRLAISGMFSNLTNELRENFTDPPARWSDELDAKFFAVFENDFINAFLARRYLRTVLMATGGSRKNKHGQDHPEISITELAKLVFGSEHASPKSFRVPHEAWEKELSKLAKHMWSHPKDELFSIKQLIRETWELMLSSQDVIDDDEAYSPPEGQNFEVNPFKYGLTGELLNHTRNVSADVLELRERSEEQTSRELEMTLGNKDWLDAQPTDGPRNGPFAYPLPSFKPPYFQDADDPSRAWNLLSREFSGDY